MTARSMDLPFFSQGYLHVAQIAGAAFGPETGIELTYLPGSSVPRLMISI
jgi:hypothetical protein